MELMEQEMGLREKSRSTVLDAMIDFTGGTIGELYGVLHHIIFLEWVLRHIGNKGISEG